MRKKEVHHAPASDQSHIVCKLERKGEVVGIKGEWGKYKIQEVCKNLRTGMEWVVLYGGPSGHTQWRHVRPEKLRKVK